jgi:hypothetical protein
MATCDSLKTEHRDQVGSIESSRPGLARRENQDLDNGLSNSIRAEPTSSDRSGNLNDFGLTSPAMPDRLPPFRASGVMVDAERPLPGRSEGWGRSRPLRRPATRSVPSQEWIPEWLSPPGLAPAITPLNNTPFAVPAFRARRCAPRCPRPVSGRVRWAIAVPGSKWKWNRKTASERLVSWERLIHRVGSARDRVRQVDRSRMNCREDRDARPAQEALGVTPPRPLAGFKESLCTGCAASSPWLASWP